MGSSFRGNSGHSVSFPLLHRPSLPSFLSMHVCPSDNDDDEEEMREREGREKERGGGGISG